MEVRISFYLGEEQKSLSYRHVVDDQMFDLTMRRTKVPLEFLHPHEITQRLERRRRFVDLISAEIAAALTLAFEAKEA